MGHLGELAATPQLLDVANPDLVESGLIGIDAAENICLWNRWVARRSRIEADVALGQGFAQVFGVPLDERVCAAIRGALSRGLPTRFSHALHPHLLPLRALHNSQVIEQKISVLPVAGPGLRRWCLVQVADMSEAVRREALLRRQSGELATQIEHLIQMQRELQRTQSRFRELANSAPVGIFETDAQASCIFVNAHWTELTGMRIAQAAGTGWLDVFESQERDALLQALSDAASATGRVCRDLHCTSRHSGEARWVRIDATPVRDASGQCVGFIGTMMDVHREREAALRDAFAAEHDALTGLVNRARFDRELERAIEGYRVDAEPFGLLFFDLDEFKAINDRYGHGVGDVVLRAVAQRLRQALRRSDVVARLGGDEFVAILFGVSSEADLAIAVAKTEQAIAQPIEHDGLILHPRCSIGRARFPTHASDAAGLLRCADQSMYEHKRCAATPRGAGLS